MYGPGTNLAHGGSLILHSECQMRYISDALDKMIDGGLEAIEPRPEKYDDWHARSQAELQTLVWGPAVGEELVLQECRRRDSRPQPVAPRRLLALDEGSRPRRFRRAIGLSGNLGRRPSVSRMTETPKFRMGRLDHVQTSVCRTEPKLRLGTRSTSGSNRSRSTTSGPKVSKVVHCKSPPMAERRRWHCSKSAKGTR